MKNFLPLVIITLVVISIVRLLIPPEPLSAPTEETPEGPVFNDHLKSLHWVSNTPQHASAFAAPPINVVIDVDLAMTAPSEIMIQKDDKDYGVGPTLIDPNALVMRKNMDPTAPDGIYTITYKPCWQDGECHKGSFEFAIDRRLAGDFEDHRGRADIPPDIQISIENGSFAPKKIRIRKNTRVIWTNNDTVDHSVTTDGSYFSKQSSEVLKPKQAFEVVFSQVGEYPYHSSSNPEAMTGSLLVED